VLIDERERTSNVFREFLTARIVEEAQSSFIAEDKQVQMKYIRNSLGDSDILISWNHPFGIMIPDAWLEAYRFIWPLR